MSAKTRQGNPPAPLRRAATFDHLKKKKPITKQIAVVLEDVTEPQFPRPSEKPPGGPTAAWEAQVMAWEEYDKQKAKVTVWMTFRSIGRRAYDELVDEHPPSKKQIEEAKEQNQEKPAFNIETFAPALIAASCIEPQMSEDEARELFDEWGAAEIAEPWLAALEVNTSRRTVNLGEGFGPMNGSGSR